MGMVGEKDRKIYLNNHFFKMLKKKEIGKCKYYIFPPFSHLLTVKTKKKKLKFSILAPTICNDTRSCLMSKFNY